MPWREEQEIGWSQFSLPPPLQLAFFKQAFRILHKAKEIVLSIPRRRVSLLFAMAFSTLSNCELCHVHAWSPVGLGICEVMAVASLFL